jgi:hypothetical protein
MEWKPEVVRNPHTDGNGEGNEDEHVKTQILKVPGSDSVRVVITKQLPGSGYVIRGRTLKIIQP